MNSTFDALIDHLVNGGFFLEEAVEFLEKGMIERALKRSESNQSLASKVLGIHRNTLQRKMVEYDIDGRRPRRKPSALATTTVAKKTVAKPPKRSAS